MHGRTTLARMLQLMTHTIGLSRMVVRQEEREISPSAMLRTMQDRSHPVRSRVPSRVPSGRADGFPRSLLDCSLKKAVKARPLLFLF